MLKRNRNAMKWRWADFGVDVVRPQMVAEPERVTKWLSFPDSDCITVRFYPVLGRAIAVVYGCSEPFHVPLNMIRDASRNSGWDVEVVSNVEFDELSRSARQKFERIHGVTKEVATVLTENGFLGYDDLSVVDPEWLANIANLATEVVGGIIEEAERRAEERGGDPIGGDLDPI
jgi:hypothetical protein